VTAAPVRGPLTARTRRPPLEAGEPEAIFIVGVPRSGTTLMRMVLGKHSRIAIADENHFLGHPHSWLDGSWSPARVGPLGTDEDVRRLVDHFYSDDFQNGTWFRGQSGFWRWTARRVPREELERRLLAGERSARGVFRVLLEAYADSKGRAVIGEKTPAHFRHVDQLLTWFPDARVIHMIRDPRAVFVSEVKRRSSEPDTLPYRILARIPPAMRALVLLQVVRTWAEAVTHHRRNLRTHDGHYRLVRFEDLVRDPDCEVERLSAFLGVAFEPPMLEQQVVSKGDRIGETGFDAGAADRWERSIRPRDRRWIERLLGSRIDELGYPR
jgi:sulfotransferase family protein